MRFRRTTLWIALSVGVVLGVVSALSGKHASPSVLFVAFLLCVATVWRRQLPALLSDVLLGFVLGNLRGGHTASQLSSLSDYYDKSVVVEGVAQNDGVYSNNSQLAFDVGGITIEDSGTVNVPGRFTVEGFGENAVFRGDHIRAEGVLRSVRGSKQGRLSFADITVIEHRDSIIERLRRSFISGMHSALPEPQASFGIGLLVGDRTGLPKSVTDDLRVVGLTHIIAVSGYNLTIIISAVRKLLSKRSKYQATVVATVLLILFVLLTGFSASIVRAAIVSMLSIIAWYYGRSIRPTLVILFTAAVTALWNPLYVWTDAGWHLSFLTFFGVLVLAPALQKRLAPTTKRTVIGSVVIESLCAQLMTVPYVLFVFGRLSIVALPVNMIIVPLIPGAMFLSFVAGTGGMLLPVVVGWFAWPARILLVYILDLVAIAARVPHASVALTITAAGLMVLYASIGLIAIVLGKTARQRDTITDINS